MPDTAILDETFRTRGYDILPNELTDEELTLLRDVCGRLLDEPVDDDMGGTHHDIGRGQDRRFLRHRHRDFPDYAEFLLGDRMKRIVSRFLGPTPYLFNEQFVVKGPGTGASFAWHQDSGYVGFDHPPYLTVWIALDDTHIANGAVYILPKNLEQDQSVTDHQWDPNGKEYVGYQGDDEGVAAEVPAGSVVVFSSVTLHRSGGNTTDKNRRALVAQYTSEPLIDPETGEPKTFAVPL